MKIKDLNTKAKTIAKKYQTCERELLEVITLVDQKKRTFPLALKKRGRPLRIIGPETSVLTTERPTGLKNTTRGVINLLPVLELKV